MIIFTQEELQQIISDTFKEKRNEVSEKIAELQETFEMYSAIINNAEKIIHSQVKIKVKENLTWVEKLQNVHNLIGDSTTKQYTEKLIELYDFSDYKLEHFKRIVSDNISCLVRKKKTWEVIIEKGNRNKYRPVKL